MNDNEINKECQVKMFGKTFKLDLERGWKTCNKCQQKKDLSNFLIDNRFNLYITYCKECGKIKTNKNRNLRRKTSINYRIRTRLTGRIRKVLIGKSKSAKTMELIGCDLLFLMHYLGKKFQDGMSWKNYGFGKDKWHIDHKIPVNIFDMTNEKHQRVAFHYTNLQPLWQHDNLSKSDILPDGRCVQNLSPQEKKDYLISLGYDYLFKP